MSARPSEEPANEIGLVGRALVFSALGDEARLRLVMRLCEDGPMSIARLTDGPGITRQAVTKHLNVRSDVGLLRSTRQGCERVWELTPEHLDRARRYLDMVSQQWDETLARLKFSAED